MPDLDATIAALREVLATNPDNLPLRMHLARLLSDNGRDADAADEYRVALAQIKERIEQQPNDLGLYEQLVEAQRALGDEAGALTSMGIMLALGGTPQSNPEPEIPPHVPLIDKQIDEIARHDVEMWRESLREDGIDPDEDVPGFDSLVYSERPTVTFADVGGMEEIKERIRMAIIYPFQHAEMFAAYGKGAGGGLLLYGPPGCGKTYVARATAGEVRARFINVGISDVLDMWHGQSERNLHELFQAARRNRPTVLFFDELEALGGNRQDMRQQFQRTLVNQFLAELDGAEGDNSNILVIGATNSPWHVDIALRRPGRFDRVVLVAPPDEEARKEILRLHLTGKPAAEDVDVTRLARETEGFSGADLRALVDAASEEALSEAMRTGKIMPMSTAMLVRALRKHKPSTADWLNTAKNYAVYSNQGGLYDEVATYLRKRKLMR